MNIGKFSVSNPVLINILTIALLILGFFSFLRLPREQFNEVAFYWVIITVPYPGAAPFDVERTITVPIENEMDGLPRVKEITSVTREGLAIIQIEFEEGMSREEFASYYQEAQTRFNQVELPEGTEDPDIDDFSSSDFIPVIEVILSGKVDSILLMETADRLEEILEGVKGVSEVTTVGAAEKQIRVNVLQAPLEAIKISINDIVQAISGINVSIPAGELTTASLQFLVRTVKELSGPIDFSSIIVRQSKDGSNVVRLTDIASVTRALDPDEPVVRYNNENAIELQISKVVGGNSVAIVNEVKTNVEQFKPTLPSGISVNYFNDTTKRIRDSISQLVNNAVSGFMILILILWFFVGFRNSVIISLGIPLTFALTFIIMELMGETLNGNTLFALVLVLGMIVDHAIVMVENCYRLRQEGLSTIDAAVQGTNEVIAPVLAGSLTTIAAFLPLMLVPGIIGKFLRVIPIIASIALFASTLQAFLFLPDHFAEWGSKNYNSKHKALEKLEVYWGNLLSFFFDRRLRISIISIVTVIGLLSTIFFVKQDLFGGEEYSYFYIFIELPQGSSRSRTSDVVAQYEAAMAPRIKSGQIKAVLSTIGSIEEDAGGELSRDNLAQILVELPERDEGRKMPVTNIMREVENDTRQLSGPEDVRFESVEGGPPTDEPVTLRFFGDDYNSLRTISSRVKQFLSQYKSLYNISDNLDPGTPELRISVQADRAAQFGLSPSQIGTYIRAAIDGIRATTIFEENENIDVIVNYHQKDMVSVDDLLNMKIPSPSGNLIPFSSVATINDTVDIASIQRVDGRREVTVTAQNYPGENIPDVIKAAQNFFKDKIQPDFPEISLEVGGEFEEFQNVLSDVGRLFILGIFLMYIIMGTQFNSYGQPLLILTAVPFAFVGVSLYLIISGTPFSTIVMYAGVALAGVAVNDSIVLISFINNLRKSGVQLKEAVISSTKIRLRPIILTSATTIGGLLPTALGIGGSSVVWSPMASTIIFGLLFSTTTTLLLVPCLYGVIEDIETKYLRKKPR